MVREGRNLQQPRPPSAVGVIGMVAIAGPVVVVVAIMIVSVIVIVIVIVVVAVVVVVVVVVMVVVLLAGLRGCSTMRAVVARVRTAADHFVGVVAGVSAVRQFVSQVAREPRERQGDVQHEDEKRRSATDQHGAARG